ncbi:MAG: protein-PII uridylyltransferase [Actinomycetota bacterium]|jgi:[protein-PII] uridylyltransferase
MSPSVQPYADRIDLLRRSALTGAERRSALSQITDGWLHELFREATAELDGTRFALAAVGGYGRGELNERSDLDLILLHTASAGDAAAVAEKLWYPIWDAHLSLDHSVRTPAEARTIAHSDVRALLGMLDVRVIAGEARLGEQVRVSVLSDWRAQGARSLHRLRELVDERRSRSGDLAQLLEPNVKESYGGLREATIVRAIAASWLVDIPHTPWPQQVSYLLDVRDALHAETSGDVLVMQFQDAVAQRMGLSSADSLLREVYLAARSIAYVSDVAWSRVARQSRGIAPIASKVLRRRGPQRVPLAEGVILADGEIVLARDVDLVKDRGIGVRAAAAAAQGGYALAPVTLERIATAPFESHARWSTEMRDSLLSLLGSGINVLAVVEALDNYGIWQRWFPEWEHVRSCPQRNPIHIYTVDRHLLMTTVAATDHVRRVTRPDLLLISALFHDIGKGLPGDHSEVGAPIARAIAERLGFPDKDVHRISEAVRWHLLLPTTATRRDVEDPHTISLVRERVDDHEVLDVLHYLALADQRATGPAVDTAWRAGLITELVRRASTSAPWHEVIRPDDPMEIEALAAQGVTVRIEPDATDPADGYVIAVGAPDQPGLLSIVSGILALHRLSVRAARVITREDRAAQVWTVRPFFGEAPEARVIHDDLTKALSGDDWWFGVLSSRASLTEAALSAEPWVQIETQGVSMARLEIRSHDQPGLLSQVTGAITACGASVSKAVVDTLGAEVIDSFFLTEMDGRPLTEERAEQVAASVRGALAGH